MIIGSERNKKWAWFNEIFEGVLLAYDVNILDKNGKILCGIHPYFGVKLKAKLLLFSPKPNMLVEGKVVRLTQASIHVIVLGFSSAIITDQDIREEFNYTTKYGEEVFASRSHKWHVIKVGTMIRFLVKSFDEEILHISGSLIPARTGSIRWLDKKSKNVCLADSSTTKRREVEGKSEMQDNETVGAAVSSVSNDHQIKKSKKRRDGALFSMYIFHDDDCPAFDFNRWIYKQAIHLVNDTRNLQQLCYSLVWTDVITTQFPVISLT
ncbi:SHS2 Rpb7-N domain-containing protein [Citrus sinensis]|uniref:SHS2 Rpb7-N domain-containing protein n=1 Tax=Citrus sinensis TaxID=2711 RepID=A0ACB8KX41_CITSI|nr:SHS2 Rpb7-N domain-containing protein [Citrus sinensis]